MGPKPSPGKPDAKAKVTISAPIEVTSPKDGKKSPSPSRSDAGTAKKADPLPAPKAATAKSQRPDTPNVTLHPPANNRPNLAPTPIATPVASPKDGKKSPSPSRPDAGTAKKADPLPAPKVATAKSQQPDTLPVNATLHPPANNHRRTTSLHAPEKPKMPADSDATSSRPIRVPHTNLAQHINIPWSETFRPGFGIDALTGEFMARSALRPFKMVDSAKPGKSRISVERLQWRGVKDLRDEFEMELGGTVNVVCPAGASAKIASILSENTSSSTILVQYKVEADFTADFIPEDVRLKEGLEKLPDKEFRDQFGDYYIAGCRRAYSCRMIVVCKVIEETITETLEREAVALVGTYFKARGAIKVADIAKTSFSLLSVIVDTEGCSADPASVFSVAVEDAPKMVGKVLRNAPGVPRVAFLYHYSSLDSCNLSRRVDVPKDLFNRARAMRDMYADLQASLLHPALQAFYFDCRTARAVLKRFEDQRKSVVQIGKDDKKAQTIDALQRDLASSKNKADVLIRRYNFIRLVANMDKGIHSPPPTIAGIDGLCLYRWDCGKTGATRKVTELKAYNLVSFEMAYKAFELEWQSPVTNGASPLWHVLGGPGPRETMTFSTQDTAAVLPPSPFPPSPKGGKLLKLRPLGQQPETTQDPGTFAFTLTDHKPICILGWSISCYWPEGKAAPTIEVDHPSNYIFSDRLSISVDNSRLIGGTVKRPL